ncbi:hypothetical protein RvY_19532, partial [Ramazzottius varieornatus]
MTHVREFFKMWSLSLRTNYLPYESACVDEQVFPFKGRCGFKQYIPTKPRSKYGLKLFLLCCCRTSYCCNIQLYTEKPVGGKPEKNQGKRVVLDLVDYLGDDSGRNVTTDNFFTSLALGEALLKKNISLIGTIRKSRPEIPSAFLPSKYREVHSSLFGHTSDFTLVSYVPKKGKAVTLLSSMHLDADIDESSKEEKPEIVMEYNRTKAGVDTLDQLTGNYSCRRKTSRWPMALFYDILDISALDAYIIWCEINPGWNSTLPTKRRMFLQDVSKKMMQRQLLRRSTTP